MRAATPVVAPCLATLLLAVFPASRAGAASPSGGPEARSVPVILDTDIGDDIDDTWALALLLRSPEVDLRLVTTDYGNTVYRARVAARLLEVAGRTAAAPTCPSESGRRRTTRRADRRSG